MNRPMHANAQQDRTVAAGSGPKAVGLISAPTERAAMPVAAYLPKERVAAIFDGIVAIAATILVLVINVSGKGDVLTFRDFGEAAHQIINWFVSFLMVAVIWTQFHFVFAHSRQWDVVLLVLTFLQVAAVSLVPFASGVVGNNPGSVAATIVFTGVMAANGYILTLNAWVLQQKPHLHVSDRSHHGLGRGIRAQFAVYTIVAGIAICGTVLHHPLWGVGAWLVCPVVLAIILAPSARQLERELDA